MFLASCGLPSTVPSRPADDSHEAGDRTNAAILEVVCLYQHRDQEADGPDWMPPVSGSGILTTGAGEVLCFGQARGKQACS